MVTSIRGGGLDFIPEGAVTDPADLIPGKIVWEVLGYAGSNGQAIKAEVLEKPCVLHDDLGLFVKVHSGFYFLKDTYIDHHSLRDRGIGANYNSNRWFHTEEAAEKYGEWVRARDAKDEAELTNVQKERD